VGLSCFEGDPAGTRHGKGSAGRVGLGQAGRMGRRRSGGGVRGGTAGGGGGLGWLEPDPDASAGRKTACPPRSVHGTVPPYRCLLDEIGIGDRVAFTCPRNIALHIYTSINQRGQ
jgi:hypothetical protein